MKKSTNTPVGTVPLCRALSKLGVCSRSQAVARIEAGEVEVDGRVCRDPLRRVSPDHATIRHRGEPVARAPRRVVLFHKPRGLITTRSDEKGRPTIYSLLPEEFRPLHAVGRLDQATSGLLLLTNDTRLSSWLTDPENAVPRVYLVTVRGEMTDETAAHMTGGVEDAGDILRADAVVVRKASGRESHLTVTLTEGKNREIRRLCAACGHEVIRLKRVQFGGLALGELEPGAFREVPAVELSHAFPAAPLIAPSTEKGRGT
jgi:23S rRNA pseudouridine2605 synthase